MKHTLAIAGMVALFTSTYVVAQEDQDATQASSDSDIETITVTADRLDDTDENRLSYLEGAQLISDEYIRAQQASTLADALRKTTSVQVDENGGNQGSVVIVRGLQGDQVSVRIDGAPQNFNQVRHGGANTIWAEPQMLQSITVIPGVASNVYGNGSLGGVIKLETKDADDVLEGEEKTASVLQLGTETNGNAEIGSIETALRLGEHASGYVYALSRGSGAYVDGAGDETLGGATGSSDINLLAKINIQVGDAGELEISRRDMRKDYTARGTQSRGRTVSSTDQFTDLEESSNAVQYLHNPTDNDLLDLSVRLSQLTVNRYRTADGSDEESHWGSDTRYFEVENVSSFQSTNGTSHTTRVGFDRTDDDLSMAYNDADGVPLQRARLLQGLYGSHTIEFNSRIAAVLGLRFDDFETTDLSSDVVSTNQALNFKTQFSYQPFAEGRAEGLSVYALYGTGFRAPSVHETFGRGDVGVICAEGRRGFSCTERIPSAELEGEDSVSSEIGLRYRFDDVLALQDQLWFQIGYIDTDVTNFIDTDALPSGSTTINGRTYRVTRSSFTNVSEAEIKGWEYAVNYSSTTWFGALTTQSLDGENLETGLNLKDVSPASTNFTVGRYLLNGRSRVGIDMTRRDSRTVDEDPSFNRLRYTIYDIFGSLSFAERYHVQVRVENALDELYTKRYQSLSLDPATGESRLLTYYQPGRNLKISFTARI